MRNIELSYAKPIIAIMLAIFFLLIPSVVWSQKMTIPTEQEIGNIFKEYEGEPGAAIGVVLNDKVIFSKGFGYANLDYSVKVSTQSVFEVGALSMQITGALIMLLENEGALSLNDPIQKYIPELVDYREGEVTIANLLHHTSGVRDYLALIRRQGSPLDISFDTKAALELMAKQQNLSITPGSTYRYSHSNYLLLATIVERVAEMPFEDYAKQSIFKPLEMNNTFIYHNPKSTVKGRAVSYEKEGNDYTTNTRLAFTAFGDGRLYTTVEDFVKWTKNFENSKIGDANFMKQLYNRGVLNNGDTSSYALGLENGMLGTHKLFAHNGYWAGYNAMHIQFLDDGLSIVTMGNNTDRSAAGKAWRVADLFFKNEETNSSVPVDHNARKSIRLSTKKKMAFCGDFFDYSIGYARKIHLVNDTLTYSDFENPDLKLLPVNSHEFIGRGTNSNITISFKKRDSGNMNMYYQRGDRPAIELTSFTPHKHPSGSLQKFIGKYYSSELDVIYEITNEENQLVVTVNGQKLFRYKPLMEYIFNSGHDGYLQFSDNSGTINGFSLGDYWLGKIQFVKM